MFVSRVSLQFSKHAAGSVSVIALAGLFLSACQTLPTRNNALLGGASSEVTGSIAASQPSLRGTQRAAKAWEKNPSNVALALNYSSQLQAIGSHGHALNVLQQTHAKNPRNREITTAYGKQLVKVGRLTEAGQILQKAQALGKPDWRIAALQGTVLDGTGYHKAAQKFYIYALKLKPAHVPILNNLGMSYALDGDIKKAETTLKDALARSPGNTKVRQNLALVTGLQGRFEDAEKIVSTDLPPNLVSANIQYLRTMLTQRNTWDSIKQQAPGKSFKSG